MVSSAPRAPSISAISPRLRLLRGSLLASWVLAACAPSGRADVPAAGAMGYELVLLAEPRSGQVPSSPGLADATMTYRVHEIFTGDPGGGIVSVRHERLDARQRESLIHWPRVILLANPDPDAPGRFVGPVPLRATPDRVDAFRRWSAPPDVRPERPVSDVLEGRTDSEVVRGERPTPEAELAPPRRRAPVDAPPIIDEADSKPQPAAEEVNRAPAWKPVPARTERAAPTPSRTTEADREPVRRATTVIPEESRPPTDRATHRTWTHDHRVASARPPAHQHQHRRVHDPHLLTHRGEPLPVTFVPVLVPTPGPGLPPAPSGRHLGPALRDRHDLKIARK